MTDPGFEHDLDELRRLAARLTADLVTLHERIVELERRSAERAPTDEREPPATAATPPMSVSDTRHGATPPHAPSPPSKEPPWATPVDTSAEREESTATTGGVADLLPEPTEAADSMPPLRHTMLPAERADEPSGRSEPDQAAELIIGRTWLNRAGAVILLLAFIFLVKYSFDQGWISPTLRVVVGAVAGLGLIGLGEYCLRRDMRSFATGVLGCGVGLLYLAVFGAYNFYHLVGPGVAGFLYTAVTVVAVAVSVHGNMLPVAVLAVIGGYGTPIALSTGTNAQVQLLSYVLALDVAFLLCGVFRRWDVLRLLAWIGTAGLFGLWAGEYYSSSARWVTWWFLLCFYVLFHAEVLLATRRGWALWTRLTASIVHADNAVFFAASYFLLRGAIPDWLGLFAVVTAAVQWLCAWRFVGSEETSRRVRLALWLNGAAMLALAAPLQFDRYLVSVSWSVQAVVTLWFCRRYVSVWLQLKGLGVLVAAIVHLLWFEYRDAQLVTIELTLGMWTFTWFVGLVMLSALCAYGGTAVLVISRKAPKDQRGLAVLLSVIGTVLLVWLFNDQWERFIASWWWLGLAVAWWLVAWRAPRTAPLPYVLTLALVLKFFCWDTLGRTGYAWAEIDGIILNRAVATGAVLTALSVAVRPLCRELPDWLGPREGLGASPNVMAFVAALIVTWTGSFEIARAFEVETWAHRTFEHAAHARGIFITAFWALQAAVMWTMGGVRRQAVAHYALVLTILAILKLTLVDTGGATSSEWSDLSGICSNRTFLVGVFVILVGLWAYRQIGRAVSAGSLGLFREATCVAMLVLVVVLTVWVPSFEISRVFKYEPLRLEFDDPWLAMHLALSVYWGLNATVCLILGFARRVAVLRYLALGLYGMTIVKVFLFDLAKLETVYRIISFMVLGVLLLFASLLYQRLSARIGGPQAAGG